MLTDDEDHLRLDKLQDCGRNEVLYQKSYNASYYIAFRQLFKYVLNARGA